MTQKMTAIIRKRPEVKTTYAIIGSGVTSLGGVNSTGGEVRQAVVRIGPLSDEQRQVLDQVRRRAMGRDPGT